MNTFTNTLVFRKSRQGFTVLGLLSAVLFWASGFLFADAAPALQRPVYIGNVTPTSMTINWKSTTGGTSVVNYGTTASYGSAATGTAGFKTVDNSPGYLHSVTITGLTPGTRYYYQVSASGTTLSPAGDTSYSFKTAPVKGSNTPFTFAIFGDSDGDANLAARFASLKPDFVISAGDVVYPYGGGVSATSEGRQDARYYDIYQGTMKNTPYYVNCGNHDAWPNGCDVRSGNTGKDVMDQENPLPGGGKMGGVNTTYSFDYGNVHFVSLNSETNISYNSSNPSASAAQIAWAYNDLKNSTQPWKVVYWHNNAWSAGTHSYSAGTLDNLVSLCEDVKANVCFWGHSHVYERWPAERGTSGFYTLGNGGKANTTTCLTNGSGGTSLHPARKCLAASSGEVGLLHVSVNGNTSTWDYYTAAGSKTDTATYTTTGTPPPADTTAPSIPAGLTATAVSSSQINLAWTASTDNVGVTGYKVFRNGTQITTVTGTTYQDTGLSPSTTYTYTVSAYDAAGNNSGQSASKSATTQAGTSINTITLSGTSASRYSKSVSVDTLFDATAYTNTSVSTSPKNAVGAEMTGSTAVKNLIWHGGIIKGSIPESWTWRQAHDDIAGAGIITHNSGLAEWRYLRVHNVEDGVKSRENPEYSNTARFYVHDCYMTAIRDDAVEDDRFEPGTVENCLFDGIYTFISEQNENVGTNDPIGPNEDGTIYIKRSYVRIYPTNAFDGGVEDQYHGGGKWFKWQGRGVENHKLAVSDSVFAIGSIPRRGWSSLDIPSQVTWVGTNNFILWLGTPGGYGGPKPSGVTFLEGQPARDKWVAVRNKWLTDHGLPAQSFPADYDPFTAPLNQIPPDGSGSSDTTAPTVPAGLTATAVSSSQINLAWTASTDNVGVTGYKVFRNGVQVATPSATTYQDTGLSPSTTYTYTVSAYDAAGNNSGQSASKSATTQAGADTTAPTVSITAPAGGATVSGTTAITATASDNIGVAGVQFKVDGANLGAEDTASPYSVSWNTTSVSNGSHTLTAVARDAAGNTKTSASVTVTVSNSTADTQAPTVPTGLTATAVSSSQINLAWTASTDNVGVTGYKVFRNGVQVATPSATTYQDTGLSPSTTYTYTVSAYDAAGNNSAQSASASATTKAVSAKFAIGDRVEVPSGPINVRETPGGTKIGTQPTGAKGTVVDGPAVMPSYTWWKINYDNAPDGWSVENYLVKITSDTTAPTVSITAPAGGATVSGTTAITATASDNIGVAGVQFKVDGANLGAEDTASPYSVSWNTTSVSNGSHTLTAVARDAAGNTKTSASVTVTVSNSTADTQAPTVPTGLTATAVSSSQINLAWTASTDNVGVTGYRVERCQGSGCTNFAQIATPSGTSYQNTGLSPSTTYTYTVSAYDAAGNNSAQSASASATTQAEVTTTDNIANDTTYLDDSGNIVAGRVPDLWDGCYDGVAFDSKTCTVVSNAGAESFWVSFDLKKVHNLTQARLFGDDIGEFVSRTWSLQYRNNISDPWQTAFAKSDAFASAWFTKPLAIKARYVRVTVFGNSAGGTQAREFELYGTPEVVDTGVFSGDFETGTAYGWTPVKGSWSVVSDGTNVYKNSDSSGDAWSYAGTPDLDYSVEVKIKPLSWGAPSGSSFVSLYGRWQDEAHWYYVTLRNNNTLELKKNINGVYTVLASAPLTVTTGNWYTVKLDMAGSALKVYLNGALKLSATDSSIASGTIAIGMYQATAEFDDVVVSTSVVPSDTTAPSIPAGLTATAVSSSQINLAWTASTDNVGVTGYKVFRNGTQITTVTGTTYQNTGLSPSTTYTYTVSAYDAAGNNSGQSASKSATTQAGADTTAPTVSITAPAGGATVSGTISVTANASDNVGVVGVQFKVDGLNYGAEDTTSPYGVSWNTSLGTNGLHTLVAVARDAAGNTKTSSAITVTVSNTTTDTQAPTVPAGLTATAVSSSQINLVWTASTDNVGVTGYRVERCQGSGCTNFAQIATPSGTSYQNTGLSASTLYVYRVRAVDAAGNLSGYSSTANATTQAGTSINTITLSGTSASRYSKSVSVDTLFNATAYTNTSVSISPKNGTAVEITGSTAAKNLVWHGGVIKGSIPESWTWRQAHDDIGGTGVNIHNSGLGEWRYLRVHNVEDGMKSRENPEYSNTARFYVHDCYMTAIRDDSIEDDRFEPGTVENCLFDGVFTFMSEQNENVGTNNPIGAGESDTIYVKKVYVRIYPTNAFDGGVEDQYHGGGKWFKWQGRGVANHKVAVSDSVFAIGSVPRRGWSSLDIPAEVSWVGSNNYILWLGTPGGYGGPKPSGVTFLEGTAAENKWVSVRNDWLTSHGLPAQSFPADYDPFTAPLTQVPASIATVSDPSKNLAAAGSLEDQIGGLQALVAKLLAELKEKLGN